MSIAILGATSHIAKGLISAFLATGEHDLLLYARSPELLRLFVSSIGAAEHPSIRIMPVSEFGNYEYDVIINCIGIGNPGKLQQGLHAIFGVTETFDNLILDHIKRHVHTLYINLSSGAAYGTAFGAPVDAATPCTFNINGLQASDYYGIAKLHAEAKHRALPELNIVDLRIFGYFSRFIDLSEKFLLSEIVDCLRHGREFTTNSGNIMRDYVNQYDLLSLIHACMTRHRINDVFDVYSAKPATKFEIIEHFALQHGLKYRVIADHEIQSATGSKNYYYSTNDHALSLGYKPAFTAIEAIESEVGHILGNRCAGVTQHT